MAIAKYFTRAATAASQVLQRFNSEEFEALLSEEIIGIAFDDDACSDEGQASLDMLLRLVARLYPSVRLMSHGEGGAKLAKRLRTLARSINADITFAGSGDVITRCLVVGLTDPGLDCPTFYLGSDGWLATFSRSRPLGSGTSSNPFGAGAASCIASANLFRAIFSEQLPEAVLDDEVHFSLLDYTQNSSANPVLPEHVSLDHPFLLGLGAIGNGTVWALARVPSISGVLEVVDGEAVDEGNLQRYVLATEKDVGRSKVDLVSRYLTRRTSLSIGKHESRWQSLAPGSMNEVVVALDTAADRIAVQATLPRWSLNSWTQRGDLGVSRHDFEGEMACLACLYLPEGKVPDEDEIIASALGVPEKKMDVIRPMLHSGQPVQEELVREIAARLRVSVEPLLPLVGQPLRMFYQRAICGGIVFELTGGREPVRVEVPMAFQSAMAGLMLAGELVKRAAGTTAPEWTTAKVNLLRRMPSGPLTERRKKDRLGRCICQDHDYLDAYRGRYAIAPAD